MPPLPDHPQETRPEIATVFDLAWAAVQSERCGELARVARFHALADALDALREAVKGCGTEIGPRGLQSCGDARGAHVLLCCDCMAKRGTAIATLTSQGDQ